MVKVEVKGQRYRTGASGAARRASSSVPVASSWCVREWRGTNHKLRYGTSTRRATREPVPRGERTDGTVLRR